MLKSPDGPLPRINALRAFEAAARHASFVRAAEELGIQQPSVSRYIAELEHALGVRLFERSGRSVTLTLAGEVYHHAVVTGLQRIGAGGLSAGSLAEDQRVVIACGHATSHLFLMPHFEAMRRVLGEDVSLRVLTLDYDMLDRVAEHEVDLVLTYDETAGVPGDRVVAFREAVTPVCSPSFAETHAQVLARHFSAWGTLPFLRIARPSRGWVTWHDWFERMGYPAPRPRYIGIEDYVYLIEAAVGGQGLALGWRHFIDRYIDAGTLVKVVDDFAEFDRSCFARLTARGHRRTIARRCLEVFSSFAVGTAASRRASAQLTGA